MRCSGENRGRKMLRKESIMSRLVDAQVRKKNSSRGFEDVTSWVCCSEYCCTRGEIDFVQWVSC